MKYLSVLFFLILTSCKNDLNNKILLKDSNDSINTKLEDTVDFKKNSLESEECLKVLYEIVKTSSLNNPFKKELKIDIESIDESKLTLRLFMNAVGSENSENNIGWLVIDPINKKIFDITNDIEEPESLNFKKEVWNEMIKCYFENNKMYFVNDINELKNWNCIEKGGDMSNGFVTICNSNFSIGNLHQYLKKEKYEDGYLLLDNIPKRDTIYKKNNVDINYKIINSKKIVIELSFSGGVTEFNLSETNGKTQVLKTIFPD
ncbi:hypothetical protein [Flavobacterium polysaccharolyticum]|uniref:Lipoprotein n=1 Tax=Flavobacterium polysaccharolyticum TaxID=3133148 RepID=A0ABU9NIJ5_9FLAO